MFFKPDEIIQQYITTSVSKTKMSSIKIIAKSILAGLMIGMGAACSSVAAHTITNVGIARLIAESCCAGVAFLGRVLSTW